MIHNTGEVDNDVNLSYQEKSIWGGLIATLVVYGNYFASGSKGNLIGTIVVLVFIQIAYQIALAIASRTEPKDERDRLIEAKSYRAGYFLLVAGIVLCMNIAVAPSVRALMMALVAAEAVKSVTQLVYYRRGV
jgi:hypothetical protein